MSGSDHRAALLALLTAHSFRRRKVVLASGRESDFFIDCKQAILRADGHLHAGHLMLEALSKLPACDAVAGVELGGCPLASAVAFASASSNDPKDAIYVRKTAKDHGSQRLLEGDSHLPAGAKIVILEDVTTTGGSTLAAAEKLRAANRDVVGVVTLVDRLEGGREAIEAAGIPVVAIYTRTDFIPA